MERTGREEEELKKNWLLRPQKRECDQSRRKQRGVEQVPFFRLDKKLTHSMQDLPSKFRISLLNAFLVSRHHLGIHALVRRSISWSGRRVVLTLAISPHFPPMSHLMAHETWLNMLNFASWAISGPIIAQWWRLAWNGLSQQDMLVISPSLAAIACALTVVFAKLCSFVSPSSPSLICFVSPASAWFLPRYGKLPLAVHRCCGNKFD